MKNPSQLLPLTFNTLQIKQLTWNQFRGNPDERMPWSAHIYWWIDYKIVDDKNKIIEVKVNIRNKSWVKQQKKCGHLLNHEQGHYIIACLCALEFTRRVDIKKKTSQQTFDDLLAKTFDRTIKQFVELEIKYDNETQHRLNYKKQQQWDAFLYDRLSYYNQIFDRKKSRFVKFSQSPSKPKKNKS